MLLLRLYIQGSVQLAVLQVSLRLWCGRFVVALPSGSSSIVDLVSVFSAPVHPTAGTVLY